MYGSDDTEVEEESHWAVNPASFALGFIAWADDDEASGGPLGEEMRGIAQGPLLKSDLPQVVGGTWAQQVGMQLVCVSGEDTGTEVLYKSSTKGGIGGFNDLLNSVLAHLKASAGTDKVVPIVELEVTSYKHPNPKFGTIYKPVFAVKKWATMDDMPDGEDEGEEEEEVVQPVAKKKATSKKKAALPAPAPEPEIEKEEEVAPKRRRRRRSAK